MGRYKNAVEWAERAQKVTPGGAQTMSKQPHRFPYGAYPTTLIRGQGATVTDRDGREYVDWGCALGAIPLGYQYEPVMRAVRCALEYGIVSASLPTRTEVLTSEAFCHFLGWPDMVRWVKTGSEACEGAVRIARRATGRDHVVLIGYHGWHSWAQAAQPEHPGIPEGYARHVTRVPYNNLDALEGELCLGGVAAVLMEPMLLEPPAPGYLANVRDLCAKRGTLLVFDEMVMGFRWATRGGEEYFGVRPDLAVYGKGLANGFPLAAIVGSRELMAFGDVVSGTFGGEVVSLAAARAVMETYAEVAWPITRQWEWGGKFQNACRALGIPVTGDCVHLKVTYEGFPMALFLQETARHGILLHPAGFNVPAVLTEKEWNVTQQALEQAARAIQEGRALEGALPQAGILQRT